jgi:hypothetical protein
MPDDSRFVEVLVEANGDCEGATLRFRTEGSRREISSLVYPAGAGERIPCEVTGWSSENGGTVCPARAVPVEDSGSGIAILIYGGDWGLKLTPKDGSAPFAEPYLLLSAESLT